MVPLRSVSWKNVNFVDMGRRHGTYEDRHQQLDSIKVES